MNNSTLLKHFLFIFLPTAILLVVSSFFLFSRERDTRKLIVLHQESIGLKSQQSLLDNKIQNLISDLMLISSHHDRHPLVYTEDSESVKDFSQELLSLSKFKKVYDQVSFLDKSGLEIIRVDYNHGNPIVSDNLQFKGERYYFKETITLKKGEVFISPFDLNIENGRIEKPFKPVIRVGTPVISDNGEKLGVVLLNYYGNELLNAIEQLSENNTGKMLLTNSEGYWLKGLFPGDEWGFMLEDRHNKTFGMRYPESWQKIQRQHSGQFEDSSGVFTFTTLSPLEDNNWSDKAQKVGKNLARQKNSQSTYWKLVSFISHEELNRTNNELRATFTYTTCALIFFFAFGAFFVALLRRKKAQINLALQEANANIENIFNSSIPLCVTDNERKLIMYNDLYSDLFNIANTLKDPAAPSPSFSCNACHNKICSLDLIFNQNQTKAICETTIGSSKEDKAHYIITNKPFINSKGELVGVLSSFQDITDLKTLQNEHAKTRNIESLGVVAGGIAHDFNNLLTAICGYILLAKNMLDPASKAAELLSKSESASFRAQKLTQRIITFSRGGNPIRKPTFIANFLVDAVKLSLSSAQYSCVFDIPADLPKVDVDEGQLLQAITSILTNAQEAMPDGGTITTSAKPYQLESEHDPELFPLPPGEYIQICFNDSGLGIQEKNLPKIFDPYFSSKQLGANKGTGLGLSTAYSIIKKHGGTIKAVSVQGQGTSIYIYLPTTKLQDQASIETSSPAQPRQKVLVMDDEILIREIVKEIIDSIGWTGEFAEEGAEAVRLYKKAMESGDPFSLVILDICVPNGMGGVETLKELKKIDPQVKAIVSSGFSDNQILTSFKKHGFAAAMPKPYTPNKLSEVIRKTLKG